MSSVSQTQLTYFLECALLYSHVADLAFFRSSLLGSKQCAGLALASLIVRVLERVPFGSKLGRKAVLFFRTMEIPRSFCAFECGIINTNLAILDNRAKRYVLSTALMVDI